MMPTSLPLVVESLGWTILHFVWQGGAVAAVLYGLLAAARRASPQLRYGLACGALLVAVAAFGGTLTWQLEFARPAGTVLVAAAESPPEPIVEAALPASVAPLAVSPGEIESTGTIELPLDPADLLAASAEPWPGRLRAWLPLVDAMWAAGVALLSLRLCVSWQAVRRLCRSALPIDDPAWSELCAALGRRLNVSRPVRLVSSASAGVPFVVGCLRPMILVPGGLLSCLTPAEVEAILAHELAHVRRHDFVVNLVQNVAETLLFYHPAVWWISSQIRREREHCCDDVAAAACGGALDYAKALVAVEQLRPAGNLLVAASGGSLVGRIRRLAGADRSSGSTWPLTAIILIATAALTLIAVGRPSWGEQEESETALAADTASDESTTDDAVVEQSDGSAGKDGTSAEESPFAGVTVIVVDAETGRRIQNFIILQGTRAGHVTSATFAQRHPGAVATIWQRHTLRSGKDGMIFFKPDDCYGETSFRVEADGYQPQQSAWVMRPTKATVVGIRMKKDEGLSGRILQPDGQPAAGAALAVGLFGRGVPIEGGEIRDSRARPVPERASDRWAIPTVFKTDDEGRFRLPNENDPCAVLVVVHDSGTVDMELADFQNKTEIRLKAWGRIEGQVWWKDRPGVNERIDCSVRRDTQYPHLIRCERRTRSGNDGKFEFDKVMPGRVQVLRYFDLPKTEDPADNADDALSFSFDNQVSDVAAGRPTEVVVGGRGRKVVGRLAGRESWEGLTIHCERQEIDLPVGKGGDVEERRAYHFWQSCPIGQLYDHGAISPRADGSFEIPDVLPGDYNVFVRDAESKLFVGSGVFEVESEQLSPPPATLDIGEIKVEPAEKSTSAEPVTEQTGEVDLPESGPPAGGEPQILHLALGRESGEAVLRFNGRKIDEATLKRLAQALADGKGGPPVLLAADKGTPYQEVVKLIDLLSSLGLKKVSLESRRQAVDGIPAPPPAGPPATFTGAEIIALVGPEVILANDVLPDANSVLEHSLQRSATAHGNPFTTPESIENLRKAHMAIFLKRLIEIKLVVVEGRRLIPKEAWGKIEKQFNAQFDKDYLPKLLDEEQCKSRSELDRKLREAGGSLMGVKRQSMEASFAEYFLAEKLERAVSPDDIAAYRESHPELNDADENLIRKQIAQQPDSKVREEFLAGLRRRTPVWTAFGDTDQSKAEIGEPAVPTTESSSAPPSTSAGKTAGQPASVEKPDAEPPPAPMTDEEVAAHPGTIKLVVLDSEKTPIPRFRVMTGIRANNDGTVSIQFRPFPRAPIMVDQTGGKPANWRVATVQIGENGVCYWKPVAGQAGEQMHYMLQVEAEGYRSDTFGWISGEATREPLEFRLVREGLFTVQVIEGNQQAQPIAGATVAIPTPQRHAILENAHLRGDSYAAFQNESAHWGQAAFERARLDRPWLVKTGTDGTCQLPESARFGPLLVVHPRGAALMTADRMTGQINFAYSAASHLPAIVFSPWGVVRGNVQWRDGAGTGERIGLSVNNLGGTVRGGPDDVFSDLEGNFEFAHVLPGIAHVSRFVLNDGELPDGKRFSFPGLDSYVTALPGTNAYAKIGGKGRTVVGRLVGRKDWNGVTVSFEPALPAGADLDEPGAIQKLFDVWADSSIGPIFFRNDFKPAADGSFELPRVLPGRYELTVSTPEMPSGGAAGVEATIEPEDTGENRDRIDLGDIDVAAPARFGIRLKAGELYRGDSGRPR